MQRERKTVCYWLVGSKTDRMAVALVMRSHHRFFLVARERLARCDEAVERMLNDRSDPQAWRSAQLDAREALHVHLEQEVVR